MLCLFIVFSSGGTGLAEDARVLPAGRSRLSFIFAQSGSVSQTFDASGHAESISSEYKLPMALTASNLSGMNKDLGALVNVLNSSGWHFNKEQVGNGYYGLTHDPSDPMLGDALSRGILGADIQANRQQYNLTYFYGITDNLSVGIFVPYMRTTVRVNGGLSGDNTAASIAKGFESQNPGSLGQLQSSLDMIANSNNETVQSLLESKGYDRVDNYDGSDLGDIVIGARYKYIDVSPRSGDWIASFQTGVTVPTGKVYGPEDITAVNAGQGAWDIGAANITNYTPVRWITFSNGLHYTFPFWSRKPMRVRANATDLFPGPEDQEDVAFRLGDKISITLGSIFHLTRALDLNVEYEWKWQSASQFNGSKTDRDYSYLSDGTGGYLETLQIGASFSTLPAFLKHDFMLPLSIAANLYIPTGGINQIIAPYGTAEVGLIF